jgi:thiamine kinase
MSDAAVPADLRAALAWVPGVRPEDPATWRLTRLAGLSNRNWRVDTPAGTYVVRLPLPDPAGYVTDRSIERVVTMAAARVGVGAPQVAADPAGVFLVSGFVEDARPAGAVDAFAVGAALRRVHCADLPISRRFDPLGLIRDYRAALGADAPVSAAEAAELDLLGVDFGAVRVPSHGDPVPQNLLVREATVTLIDWEYAALIDPAWDLGYFALTASCAGNAIDALLAGYGDPALTVERVAGAIRFADAVNRLWTAVRERAAVPALSAPGGA